MLETLKAVMEEILKKYQAQIQLNKKLRQLVEKEGRE